MKFNLPGFSQAIGSRLAGQVCGQTESESVINTKRRRQAWPCLPLQPAPGGKFTGAKRASEGPWCQSMRLTDPPERASRVPADRAVALTCRRNNLPDFSGYPEIEMVARDEGKAFVGEAKISCTPGTADGVRAVMKHRRHLAAPAALPLKSPPMFETNAHRLNHPGKPVIRLSVFFEAKGAPAERARFKSARRKSVIPIACGHRRQIRATRHLVNQADPGIRQRKAVVVESDPESSWPESPLTHALIVALVQPAQDTMHQLPRHAAVRPGEALDIAAEAFDLGRAHPDWF